MSTYLYYRCLQHNPPLKSADEVTQHAHNREELDRARQWLKERKKTIERWTANELVYEIDYFEIHAATFLADHEDCIIDMIDEYGQRWGGAAGTNYEPLGVDDP